MSRRVSNRHRDDDDEGADTNNDEIIDNWANDGVTATASTSNRFHSRHNQQRQRHTSNDSNRAGSGNWSDEDDSGTNLGDDDGNDDDEEEYYEEEIVVEEEEEDEEHDGNDDGHDGEAGQNGQNALSRRVATTNERPPLHHSKNNSNHQQGEKATTKMVRRKRTRSRSPEVKLYAGHTQEKAMKRKQEKLRLEQLKEHGFRPQVKKVTKSFVPACAAVGTTSCPVLTQAQIRQQQLHRANSATSTGSAVANGGGRSSSFSTSAVERRGVGGAAGGAFSAVGPLVPSSEHDRENLRTTNEITENLTRAAKGSLPIDRNGQIIGMRLYRQHLREREENEHAVFAAQKEAKLTTVQRRALADEKECTFKPKISNYASSNNSNNNNNNSKNGSMTPTTPNESSPTSAENNKNDNTKQNRTSSKVFERLSSFDIQSHKKHLQALKLAEEEAEMQNCTFHPEIAPLSQQIISNNNNNHNPPTSSLTLPHHHHHHPLNNNSNNPSSSPRANATDRLYKDAQEKEVRANLRRQFVDVLAKQNSERNSTSGVDPITGLHHQTVVDPQTGKLKVKLTPSSHFSSNNNNSSARATSSSVAAAAKVQREFCDRLSRHNTMKEKILEKVRNEEVEDSEDVVVNFVPANNNNNNNTTTILHSNHHHHANNVIINTHKKPLHVDPQELTQRLYSEGFGSTSRSRKRSESRRPAGDEKADGARDKSASPVSQHTMVPKSRQLAEDFRKESRLSLFRALGFPSTLSECQKKFESFLNCVRVGSSSSSASSSHNPNKNFFLEINDRILNSKSLSQALVALKSILKSSSSSSSSASKDGDAPHRDHPLNSDHFCAMLTIYDRERQGSGSSSDWKDLALVIASVNDFAASLAESSSASAAVAAASSTLSATERQSRNKQTHDHLAKLYRDAQERKERQKSKAEEMEQQRRDAEEAELRARMEEHDRRSKQRESISRNYEKKSSRSGNTDSRRNNLEQEIQSSSPSSLVSPKQKSHRNDDLIDMIQEELVRMSSSNDDEYQQEKLHHQNNKARKHKRSYDNSHHDSSSSAYEADRATTTSTTNNHNDDSINSEDDDDARLHHQRRNQELPPLPSSRRKTKKVIVIVKRKRSASNHSSNDDDQVEENKRKSSIHQKNHQRHDEMQQHQEEEFKENSKSRHRHHLHRNDVSNDSNTGAVTLMDVLCPLGTSNKNESMTGRSPAYKSSSSVQRRQSQNTNNNNNNSSRRSNNDGGNDTEELRALGRKLMTLQLSSRFHPS